MVQRRGYPRGPLERSGNNTWRDVDVPPSPIPVDNNNGLPPRSPDDRDPTPRHKREGIEPNCCVLFTKRKGFGTLGEKQSEPGSIHKTNYLLKSFKAEQFQRYRVNVYLK
jgi:hypothetical protein